MSIFSAMTMGKARSTFTCLLVLALCSWHLDTGYNDNTVSRVLAVRALAEQGTLDITPHHELTGDKAETNGRFFSDKAPLPTFAVAAVWKVMLSLGISPSGTVVDKRILLIGGWLCGSIPLALIILLVVRQLRSVRPVQTLLLGVLPILGSFLFVYGGTFYNHLPAAACALLAAILITRQRPWLAGLFAGLAAACDASMLLPICIWMMQIIARKQSVRPFLFGLLPGAAITMVNNALVTGSPFTFPSAHAVNYGIMRIGYGFGTWQPQAFWGLTFSSYRGLFFYCPALLVVVGLAWRHRGRLLARTTVLDPFILPSVLLILAFMTHGTWWGGWTYGPRYLTVVPVLLLYRALPSIAASQALARATIALSAFGLVCAFAAKTTAGYSLPTNVADPMIDMVLRLVLHKEFDATQWPVALGFSPVMASAFFALAVIFALRWLQRTKATN